VLCKSFVPEPGYIVFYTNYRSSKAQVLENNQRVAAVFHWDTLGRQIRIEGLAVPSPADESDAYFATRSWGSQLGAWGSDQSREIASRDALIAQLRERARTLGIVLGADTQSLADSVPPRIARPPHWGGYRIWAEAIELWVEGTDRIHDRARWTRELTACDQQQFTTGAWRGTRLQP
jgi:pyridoxamine 5'-phosphate oxidase